VRNRYIPRSDILCSLEPGEAMRAETIAIVDEIKQSLGLLRRHL
jgi:hypothetical protein